MNELVSLLAVVAGLEALLMLRVTIDHYGEVRKTKTTHRTLDLNKSDFKV